MENGTEGKGYVVVSVAIHRCGIPLEGAKVTIRRSPGDGSDAGISYTGIDGLSGMFAVDAPLRGGGDEGAYYIDVEKRGYSSVRNYKVSVYGGVTMRQPIYVLPLIDL